MFKVDEIVVCVNVKSYVYSDYWESKKTDKQKKDLNSITIGKKYDVIKSDKHKTRIKDDNGIIKTYRTDRFKSLTRNRKVKLKKLIRKIKTDKLTDINI